MLQIRTGRPADDAGAVAAIYRPVVEGTRISFEEVAPTAEEMARRMGRSLQTLPWLVAEDARGVLLGYAYAGPYAERASYRWSVTTTVYVHESARRLGVGRRLYEALFAALVPLGYRQAFAGITLPNEASVGLHEAMGFERIGVYRDVGFKLGAWADVGWWQRPLRPGDESPPGPLQPYRPGR